LFKNLDVVDTGVINCANKNKNANLEFQGRGDIELTLKNGKKVTLSKVIYAKNLAKNLLSLRKFADQGMKIYLDNKRVNIYDPISRKTVISGIYRKHF